MKLALSALILSAIAFATLAYCSARPRLPADESVEAPAPAAFLNVQVSLSWSLESSSTTNDVTIGKSGADWKSHAACYFQHDTRYLMGLAPWTTTMKASTDIKDYVALADSYVQTLRTISGLNWGVDSGHAYEGHCWNSTNQVWQDCPTTVGQPPNSYAFQLLENSAPYFDSSKVANPAGTVNINYYVIVQLQ